MQYIGAATIWEHRERSAPPPEMEKNCCRKMIFFSKDLLLATTFQKIVKNSIFLLKFYQKLSKISQNFPTIRVFRPNARNINSWFVKFFETFRKFSGVRGALPPDPLRGRPP